MAAHSKSSTTLSIISNRPFVVRTDCACTAYFTREDCTQTIVKMAEENKTRTVVLIGGCADGHSTFVIQTKKTLAEKGITLIWIDYRQIRLTTASVGRSRTAPALEVIGANLGDTAMESCDLDIKSYSQARVIEMVLPLLLQQAERISQVREKIEWEKTALQLFPILRPVERLSSESNPILQNWFGINTAADANANLAVAFSSDIKMCRIIGKSTMEAFQVIGFNGIESHLVTGFRERDGGLRIHAYQRISLILCTKPGHFQLEPHPEPDVTDPNARYIPVPLRLTKVIQVHERRGLLEHCFFCGKTKWALDEECEVRKDEYDASH